MPNLSRDLHRSVVITTEIRNVALGRRHGSLGRKHVNQEFYRFYRSYRGHGTLTSATPSCGSTGRRDVVSGWRARAREKGLLCYRSTRQAAFGNETEDGGKIAICRYSSANKACLFEASASRRGWRGLERNCGRYAAQQVVQRGTESPSKPQGSGTTLSTLAKQVSAVFPVGAWLCI